MMSRTALLVAFLILSVGFVSAVNDDPPVKPSTYHGTRAVVSDQDIQVPPPPFSDGIFPCSDCHGDMDTDATPRTLEDEHDGIQLEHGPPDWWCLDCHSAANRDQLHLASGRTVEFSQSYLLCGQCHGDKLRDWRVGVHGKRTGNWNGTRQYLLCVHCHNPHSTSFKPIKPEPPPVQPEKTKINQGGRP